MRINRAAIKNNAKLMLRENRPKVYLISLLLVVAILVLNALIYIVSAATGVYSPFAMDVTNEFYIGYTTGYTTFSFWQLILFVAVAIMGYMLYLGYASFSLHLSRRTPGSYRDLLGGFGRFGRALGVGVLTWVFWFLWTFLYVVILIGALVAIGWIIGITGVNLSEFALPLLGIIVLIVGAIVVYALSIRIVLRFALAPYLLFDHPEITAPGCIRESKRMMKGRKWEYFVLMLSFLGWDLLAALPTTIFGIIGAIVVGTGGSAAAGGALIIIGMLCSVAAWVFLLPYLQQTIANYYTAVADLYFSGAGNPAAPSFPGQPSPFLGQSGPFPGQSGPFPGQTGPFPGQSGPFPGQTGPFPGQTGPFPGQTGPSDRPSGGAPESGPQQGFPVPGAPEPEEKKSPREDPWDIGKH